MQNLQRDIPLIAIDGGPCSGKDSFLFYLGEELAREGIRVLIMPEVSRDLKKLGYIPGETLEPLAFELLVASAQLAREAALIQEARMHPEIAAIVTNRGLPHFRAYCGDMMYRKVLALLGMTPLRALSRYKGVIVLASAAVGSREFYSQDDERPETAEEAAVLDAKTLDAYIGHYHLKVISNRDANGRQISWNEKRDRAMTAVMNLLSSNPKEIERKFLVREPKMDEVIDFVATRVVEVPIRQSYLNRSRHAVRRIRQWVYEQEVAHFFEEKAELSDRTKNERGGLISPAQFARYAEHIDPRLDEIVKVRHCFAWLKDDCYHYDELDWIDSPARHRGLWLLEKELLLEDDPIAHVPGIIIVDEVTGDPKFSMYGLARKK